MNLTLTLPAAVRLVIRADDQGTCSISVRASAPYAPDVDPGLTATAEVAEDELPPAEVATLRAVCQRLLEAAGARLGPRLAQAVAKAREVAIQHQEI